MEPKQRTGLLFLLTFLLVTCYLLSLLLRDDNLTERGDEQLTNKASLLSKQDNLGMANSIGLPPGTASLAINGTTGQKFQPDPAFLLEIKMYGDKKFVHEKYSFHPSEKVFLLMDFSQLEAGDYNLLALWKNPAGQIVNTSKYTLSLSGQSRKHRIYFWVKLIKNGIISKIMTGKEYNGVTLGTWNAEIYLNGARIATQHFVFFN